MIERTIVAASVMATVGFLTFAWMIENGWDDVEARNVLLLLMVLFENVHIGNCRSETKSALYLSPFRSPVLFGGAVCAFLIHFAAMYFPPAQAALGTRPLDLTTWVSVIGLALTIFVAMELHKFSWWLRYGSRRRV